MDRGHFHWNELMTKDPAGARKFYEDALGWTFNEMPMENGTYHIAMDGETPICGIMDMEGVSPPGVPPHWFAYIAVDDIDARVEKARAGGANVMKEPFDIEGIGRIAIIVQPDGAAIGWMTPAN